jgi:hypothetical protein
MLAEGMKHKIQCKLRWEIDFNYTEMIWRDHRENYILLTQQYCILAEYLTSNGRS